MKPLASVLILAGLALAACSPSSHVYSTGETVSYDGITYPIYEERFHYDPADTREFPQADRRLIGTPSRYVDCKGDCQATMERMFAPDT